MNDDNFLKTLHIALGDNLDSAAIWLWSFVNTPFAQILIGTGVAAFFGAYGASVIIERNKRRDELLRELRITNASIMVSFEICNSFLSLKKQHVKKLGAEYSDAKKLFEEFQAKRKKREIPPSQIFEIHADLQSLSPMLMPGYTLEKQIFEQIFAGARTYTLTNTLNRTISSLNSSIVSRNELITILKNSSNKMPNTLPEMYFGFPNSDGNVDTSYPDTMNSICSLTDDCIYFSKLLCEDLVSHGEKTKARLGKRALRINTPNFSKAVEGGLMPDPKNYEDWTTMFVKNGTDKKKIRWPWRIRKSSKL